MSAVPLGRIPVGPLLPFAASVPHNRYDPQGRGRRDPFDPVDDPASPYRLPKSVRRTALAFLRHFPSREAAYRLLSFLGRFQAHPENLGRLFPVDRRALSTHKALGLSEGQVRGYVLGLRLQAVHFGGDFVLHVLGLGRAEAQVGRTGPTNGLGLGLDGGVPEV